ncbi:hypothetical protein AGMMS50256_32200 [Betaproteobacteria bacterium]|nr:hypothetical protein AGMMS50256_32110 [Betaproteobacteria bacterium]GHU36084.1 hypothetical protein AGMMS50256_32200 [Betaproteobacteria bacterium]
MQIFITRIIGYNPVAEHNITVQDLINSYNGSHAKVGGDNSLFAPGQYTNFAYVFGMFALPGAALGMLFAAPKGENRKLASSIVIPGAIVSSLTGASEAIEFTFLFLAP